MSLYGQHWKIDGVQAAFIMRGTQNGRYRVLFERAFASIEQIEAINWAHPAIEHTNLACPDEIGLPDGYGFNIVRISYDSGNRSYTAEVEVASQYLGDVTGYQAQIDELDQAVAEKNAALGEKDATISAQAVTIQEKDAVIVEKEAAIAEQSATISAKDAQLAEKDEIIENQAAAAQAREDELAAAYVEGVESNG